MRHLDLLLQKDPHLRGIDYQLLVGRAQADPEGTWDELVEASTPIVYTAAVRLADDLRNGPSLAEDVTLEVFDRLADDDFALLRGFVGNAKWSTYLVRLTQRSPILQGQRRDRERPAARVEDPLPDPDRGVPALDSQVAELLAKEGDRFQEALRRSLGTLHRDDRLLLGLRYEQDLTLRELDHLLRLGSPERIAALVDRVGDALQPLRAVAEAWSLDDDQKRALLRVMVRRLYATSMETDEDRTIAPATQHR